MGGDDLSRPRRPRTHLLTEKRLGRRLILDDHGRNPQNSTNRRQTAADGGIHEARTLGCGTFTRRSETSLEIVDHPDFTFENSRARSRTGFLGTDSSGDIARRENDPNAHEADVRPSVSFGLTLSALVRLSP